MFSHSQTVLILLTKSRQAPDESRNRCSVFFETVLQVQPNTLGTRPSLGAHTAELHCYTSLRVLAKKRWFACVKMDRKMVGLAGLGLTQYIRCLVSEEYSIIHIIRAWYTKFLSRWLDLTFCVKKLDWATLQQPSVMALNWQHGQNPLWCQGTAESQSLPKDPPSWLIPVFTWQHPERGDSNLVSLFIQFFSSLLRLTMGKTISVSSAMTFCY